VAPYTDKLPQELAGLDDQLWQRPTEVAAIDVAAHSEAVCILDTDDLALGQLELRVVAKHQEAGVGGPHRAALRVVGCRLQCQEQIGGLDIALPRAALRCPKRQMLLDGLSVDILQRRPRGCGNLPSADAERIEIGVDLVQGERHGMGATTNQKGAIILVECPQVRGDLQGD
jgi:hypothetical protein